MSHVIVYYYCCNKNISEDVLYNILFGNVKNISTRDIDSTYVNVYELSNVILDNNVENYLEDLFKLFNSGDNPLCSNEKQSLIQKSKSHTSMSVGDVVCIDENYYMVCPTGFKKIIE
jgi:hypothetical protein